MRRLALLALIVPLTAGCGWADLLLAPTYSNSMSSGPPMRVIHVAPPPIHRGCVMYTPRHKVRPCATPYRSGPAGPAFRSCGEVGVGIGWHLSVDSMTCHAGAKLVHHYFSGSNNDTVRTVLGYRCAANTFRVVCQHDASIAVFIGNR